MDSRQAETTYLEGEFNSPVVECPDKGLTTVWSPSGLTSPSSAQSSGLKKGASEKTWVVQHCSVYCNTRVDTSSGNVTCGEKSGCYTARCYYKYIL
eukprot:8643432-Pyramimonas_sp.AAC.1